MSSLASYSEDSGRDESFVIVVDPQPEIEVADRADEVPLGGFVDLKGMLPTSEMSRSKSWSQIAASPPAMTVSDPPSRSTSPKAGDKGDDTPSKVWKPLIKVFQSKPQPMEAPPSNLMVEEDEDGVSGRLAIKATGGVSRINGMKLRPDEAKRKAWIIDKKNAQRSGFR